MSEAVPLPSALISSALTATAGSTKDAGLAVSYLSGMDTKYGGLMRDHTDAKFKFFTDSDSDPTTVVDFTTPASVVTGELHVKSSLTVDGTITSSGETEVKDAIFLCSAGNPADLLNTGYLTEYKSSGIKYSGLVRRAGGTFSLLRAETTKVQSDLAFTNFDDLQIRSLINDSGNTITLPTVAQTLIGTGGNSSMTGTLQKNGDTNIYFNFDTGHVGCNNIISRGTLTTTSYAYIGTYCKIGGDQIKVSTDAILALPTVAQTMIGTTGSSAMTGSLANAGGTLSANFASGLLTSKNITNTEAIGTVDMTVSGVLKFNDALTTSIDSVLSFPTTAQTMVGTAGNSLMTGLLTNAGNTLIANFSTGNMKCVNSQVTGNSTVAGTETISGAYCKLESNTIRTSLDTDITIPTLTQTLIGTAGSSSMTGVISNATGTASINFTSGAITCGDITAGSATLSGTMLVSGAYLKLAGDVIKNSANASITIPALAQTLIGTLGSSVMTGTVENAGASLSANFASGDLSCAILATSGIATIGGSYLKITSNKIRNSSNNDITLPVTAQTLLGTIGSSIMTGTLANAGGTCSIDYGTDAIVCSLLSAGSISTSGTVTVGGAYLKLGANVIRTSTDNTVAIPNVAQTLIGTTGSSAMTGSLANAGGTAIVNYATGNVTCADMTATGNGSVTGTLVVGGAYCKLTGDAIRTSVDGTLTLPSASQTMLGTLGNSAMTGSLTNAGGTTAVDFGAGGSRLPYVGINIAPESGTNLYAYAGNVKLLSEKTAHKIITIDNEKIVSTVTDDYGTTNSHLVVRVAPEQGTPAYDAFNAGTVDTYTYSSVSSSSISDTKYSLNYSVKGSATLTPVITVQKDKVGINNSSPTANVDVTGSTNITGNLTVGGTLTIPYLPMCQETIQVAKAGTLYATIQSAIDSITDATSTKRYTVMVHPGMYTENLTLKDYVNVTGFAQDYQSTIISGTVTFSATYGDISFLKIRQTSVVTNDVKLITVAGGEHIIMNCILQYSTSSDISGTVIYHTGGLLHMFNSIVRYTNTSTALTALDIKVIHFASGTHDVIMENSEFIIICNHVGASLYVVYEDQVSTCGTMFFIGCHMQPILGSTRTGATVVYYLGGIGGTVKKHIDSGRTDAIQTSLGTVCAICQTSALGNTTVTVRHTTIDVRNNAANFIANVGAGDTLLISNTTLLGSELFTGAGTISKSYADGTGVKTDSVTTTSVHTTASAGALATGSTLSINPTIVDKTSTTGGEIYMLDSSLTSTTGSASVFSMKAGNTVNPICQDAYDYGNLGHAWKLASGVYTDVTTAFNNAGTLTNMFNANNNAVLIGSTSIFNAIAFALSTNANGAGVVPVFAYSTVSGSFTNFTPTDGTNGFRQSGSITFVGSALASWAPIQVNAEGTDYYYIRITRSGATLATLPVERQVQVDNTLKRYQWDKTGLVSVDRIILQARATAPTDPVNGMMYFDSAVDRLRYYRTGNWQNL